MPYGAAGVLARQTAKRALHLRKDGLLVACLAVHLPVTSGGYRASVLSGRVSRSKREALSHAFFRGRTGKIIPMSTLPLPIAAFVAGLISFLSPCVLPLVPGYVSLISGAGVEELKSNDAQLLRKVMVNSGAFILGFAIVFVTLGALATEVGQVLARYKSVLGQVAGIVIIVFGLH